MQYTIQYTIAFFRYGKTLIDPLKFIRNYSAEFETLVAAQAYGYANAGTIENSDEADGFQVRCKGRPTREFIIKAHPDA
ncbi:MAG TPA: hypothetical protein VFC56_07480 [Stellaceae bacterium]|nr:hypothetical protein [Stellaceae bacterium]